MAVLRGLPILYLIQDNEWGISATGEEMRAMDAYEYAAGFKGLERMRIDGTEFEESYHGLEKAIAYVRASRKPILVHATCPLLGHHTSGVRKEWYRGQIDPLFIYLARIEKDFSKWEYKYVDLVGEEKQGSLFEGWPELQAFEWRDVTNHHTYYCCKES